MHQLSTKIRHIVLKSVILFFSFEYLLGQSTYPVNGSYSVGENYPTISVQASVDITLPATSLDGQASLMAWELNSSALLRPQKGTPNTWNSQTFTYTPMLYQEGTDTITWKACEVILSHTRHMNLTLKLLL